MAHRSPPQWIAKAAEEFNRHENRTDGAHVVGCLANGLSILRDSVYLRVHQDVQSVVGRDSMLMPVSEVKAKLRATEHIETYLTAESAAAVEQFGYLVAPDEWYLQWLAGLRLGEDGLNSKLLERTKRYLAETPDHRRLAFCDALGRVLPESRQAPLVLFRLVPLAVQIATACAFGDRDTCSRLRRQQVSILPAISDCRQCRGRLLECVEQCRACGNPLWKHEWLTAVD